MFVQSKWILPFLHAEDVELLLDSKITLKVRMFFPLSSFIWFTNIDKSIPKVVGRIFGYWWGFYKNTFIFQNGLNWEDNTSYVVHNICWQ